MPSTPPRILFVTGKLAEPSLRRTLKQLAPIAGFEFQIAVLPITVAALATTSWIARHWTVTERFDRVLLPGLCIGEVRELEAIAGTPVERGPADLLDLPEYFGKGSRSPAGYGDYDIEILAEINHVARLRVSEVVARAKEYRDCGADLIDLGCDPGEPGATIAETVRALRGEGMRVSIDSFNLVEVRQAIEEGAELILSANSGNAKELCNLLQDSGRAAVIIPDTPADLDSLDQTITTFRSHNISFRIDPVLEPIGFGFAASLGRYLEVRRRYPRCEMLMGVGNLTELTDADSAGINVLLLGFCQELGIRSVLTTEVINWSRSSVKELNLARRLVRHACSEHVLPKHVEPKLVMLRDPKMRQHDEQYLQELASHIADRNVRLFAERDQLYALSERTLLQSTDAFVLFEELQLRMNIDSSHAFYLGYELAKAVTALTLGKNYVQDQALNWGFLTRPETSHRRVKQGELNKDV